MIKQISLLPRPQIESALVEEQGALSLYIEQQERPKEYPPRSLVGRGDPTERIQSLTHELQKARTREQELSDALGQGFEIIAQYPPGRDAWGVTLILYKADEVAERPLSDMEIHQRQAFFATQRGKADE